MKEKISSISFLGAYFIAFGVMLGFAFFQNRSVGFTVATQMGVCLSLWFYLKLFPQLKKAVLKDTKTPFRHLFFGMIWAIFCIPIVIVVSVTLNMIFQLPQIEQEAVKALKMHQGNPLAFAGMAFAIVFLVPIIEEILIRGFMQTYIKGFVGTKYAIIITSIIFAFFHYSATQGMQNVDILISLFVLSCFLGSIYERENSLWAPIGLHSTFNAFTTLLIGLKSLILV